MNKVQKHKLLEKQVKNIYGENYSIEDLDERTQLLLNNINASYNSFDYQIQQNNILFEEEENIVFTIGVKSGVLRANQKFYKTFGFKDLEDFKTQYDCICELFIEDKGYLKETTSEAHWTLPITQNPNKRHKALLRNFLGRKCIYSVTLKTITLAGNTFKICTFTDITELEKTLQSLKKSEEAKNSFMSNISHEIRTPLNGILGFSELLSRTQLTNTQTEYINHIYESGQLLTSIINSILDFSNFENKKLQLELSEMNIHKDLYADLYVFKQKFQKKSIEYKVRIDPTISESLITDKSLLIQALSNLMSNAKKFTPQSGQVTVEVKKLESHETYEVILFSVKDTGIGIGNTDLQKIFDSFTQADDSYSKEHQGIGLGLSITKSICEEMGTELIVHSKLGEGSIFSFKLMLEKARKND